MPFVKSNQVEIYYEEFGKGPPLLLHHSTGGCIDSWRIDGFLDDLKNDYRLIVMDARGHGASDKPHDQEAYSGTILAKDVLAVMDHAGLEQTVYWGYSLGAYVGFNVAALAPERLSGLIVGGGSPHEEDMTISYNGDREDNTAAYEAFMNFFNLTLEGVTERERKQFLANDFCALLAMLNFRPSLASSLVKMTMPALVYIGDCDARLESSRRAAACMPYAKLIEFPGFDHYNTQTESTVVLPFVREFLKTLKQ